MKTEIEFRFWDKEWKKMVYYEENGNIFPAITLNGGLFIPYSGGYTARDVILMQYIGIKDNKNGKKIYVDDIIRLPDGNVGIVKFEGGIFFHTAHSNINGMPYWHEKIGNIHENPELFALETICKINQLV